MISKDRYQQLTNDFDEKDVELVAVSKTRSIEEMLQLKEWGQLNFGENRIEEINRNNKLSTVIFLTDFYSNIERIYNS